MRKIFILLISGILLISISGCKNSLETATSISNSAEYFAQDDLIEIVQLPWEISSDETREIIGEIDENYLKSYGSQIKLMPINQLTFTDIGLTSSIRCYYFDEQDKLYNVWYSFSFNDKEQAKKKMEEVIEYFKERFPSSFEYKYNEKSSTVLIDAVTQEKFDIPMASWFDETGSQLRLTVEPEEGGFYLSIKLASNKGHSLF